jgi:hypothetical protein
MNKSAYLITKPIQYVNATNIPDKNKKDCYIVDNFIDSRNFYLKVKEFSNIWDNVYFINSRDEFYKLIVRSKYLYNKVYLDSDQGFKALIFSLLIQPINIYTYEEGYGSYLYLRNPKKIKDLAKIKIYKLIGCYNWFGGNFYTKAHYVYKPLIHKILIPENAKPVLKLDSNIIEKSYALPEIYNQLNELKLDKFTNKNVILYLTSWELNEKVYEVIETYSNFITLIKPHPHISCDEKKISKFDYILNTNLPAELVIDKLQTFCTKLIIVHENSSALLYFTHAKFNVINISESSAQLRFNEVSNKFKSD